MTLFEEENVGVNINEELVFIAKHFKRDLLERIWKEIRTTENDLPKNAEAFLVSQKIGRKIEEKIWKDFSPMQKWRWMAQVFIEYGKKIEHIGNDAFVSEENGIFIKEATRLCKSEDIERAYLSALFHELNHIDQRLNGKFAQSFFTIDEINRRIEENQKS